MVIGVKPDRRIVSAAMLMKDGTIIPGVRHFSPDMRDIIQLIYGPKGHLQVAEQGFIDSGSRFVGRKEAWDIAKNYGQIRKVTGQHGTLYSEDLY